MARKPLQDKVALITGSSRGIGLATARELAARGARIVLNARPGPRLDNALASLRSQGADAIAAPADVTDPDACRAMIEQAVAHFGRLDILVNNAGISMRANLEDLDAAACKKILDLNMHGCVYPTLYAIPQLKQNRGSVVYTSSIAGLIGLPTATLYCAAKTGLRGFADALRCELAPAGVHVGIVFVGFTENDPEKTVEGAGGQAVSPDRPGYMTQAEVGRAFADLIQHRRRQIALTPIGKFAKFAAWLSPEFVEQAIIMSRRAKLSDRLGIH